MDEEILRVLNAILEELSQVNIKLDELGKVNKKLDIITDNGLFSIQDICTRLDDINRHIR